MVNNTEKNFLTPLKSGVSFNIDVNLDSNIEWNDVNKLMSAQISGL